MSFIFISLIYANKDDSLTKKYNNKIYANPDKTRIAVIKKDGSSFDKNDIEKFNKIKYVRMADICDRAGDINYYCDEGKDYQYSYGTVNKNSVSEFNRIVTYAKGIKKALKEYDARWGIASGEKARASCNMTVWLSGADVNTIKEDVNALRGRALIYIKKRKSDGNLSNKKDSLKLELTDEMTDYSGTFLEISKHLYYQYFKNESRQASVYITHYAKTDKVIDAINKADKKYQAVSAYRMSLEGYDNDKVSERLATLGISFVVLVFMAILEVAILSAVMKNILYNIVVCVITSRRFCDTI